MVLHSHVDGKRDRGKPIKTWVDNIMEDIKAQGMDIREAADNAIGRDQLGDFLLGPHRRRTPDGGESWTGIFFSSNEFIWGKCLKLYTLYVFRNIDLTKRAHVHFQLGPTCSLRPYAQFI